MGNVPTYGGPLDSYTIPTKDVTVSFHVSVTIMILAVG